MYSFVETKLYKMFLKKIIFSKKSLISMIFGLVIPFFDPYYNLTEIEHVFLSLKIWLTFLLITTIIFSLIRIFK